MRARRKAGARWSSAAQIALVLIVALAPGCASSPGTAGKGEKLERVVVDPASRGFRLEGSGRPFVPVGFNYDHDDRGRLLEDYWEAEWPSVAEDFAEMRRLGATVARIHLQLGKFLPERGRPDMKALERLEDLLALAEREGLRLDLTGLGSYRKPDAPRWYDALDEEGRWAAQAEFWEAVAARCAKSPAVFAYDLMNEPVSPAGLRQAGEWLGGQPLGEYYYVQMISLDQAGRPRPAIARAWIERMSAAIRKHDRRALITVGLVDWSLDRPGLSSGFVPAEVAPALDFVAVHLYPQASKVTEAIQTLRGFAVGKPVVIEETFPLGCSIEEFRQFLRQSREVASGWIGFYWGKTPEELRRSSTIRDQLLLAWLEVFEEERGELMRPAELIRSSAR